MANVIEDGVASMMGTFLAVAGSEYPYTRDASVSPVVMHKRPQRPIQVDNGNGGLVEIELCDFITTPDLLPFGLPQRGDRIQDGDSVYSVQSPSGDKVFFQVADAQIRIHTKLVKS